MTPEHTRNPDAIRMRRLLRVHSILHEHNGKTYVPSAAVVRHEQTKRYLEMPIPENRHLNQRFHMRRELKYYAKRKSCEVFLAFVFKRRPGAAQWVNLVAAYL